MLVTCISSAVVNSIPNIYNNLFTQNASSPLELRFGIAISKIRHETMLEGTTEQEIGGCKTARCEKGRYTTCRIDDSTEGPFERIWR